MTSALKRALWLPLVLVSVNCGDPSLEVEAACGQCQLGLVEPKGCDLAVRIGGHAHFVDGTDIDAHGDAHGERGMCNTIRRARVTGAVVDGRFKAKSFTLID